MSDLFFPFLPWVKAGFTRAPLTLLCQAGQPFTSGSCTVPGVCAMPLVCNARLAARHTSIRCQAHLMHGGSQLSSVWCTACPMHVPPFLIASCGHSKACRCCILKIDSLTRESSTTPATCCTHNPCCWTLPTFQNCHNVLEDCAEASRTSGNACPCHAVCVATQRHHATAIATGSTDARRPS